MVVGKLVVVGVVHCGWVEVNLGAAEECHADLPWPG
jgi:hypothetical protein